MQIKRATFVTSLTGNQKFSGQGLPQIAIAGKSNVGKSSLINCLCNQNKLARVSSEPGKTRLVNVFRINDDFHLLARRRRAAAIKEFLKRKKQNKENNEMKELAKRLIGEDCIIYTITSESGSIQGVLKEVEDGGLVIEKTTGETEIVNLDFVTRIREYPRKKNGKKKSIVVD